MRAILIPHPDTPSVAISAVTAEVARTADGLVTLCYRARGAIGDLRLPPRALSARADALWKHTCFEAFIGAPGGGYVEVNLSPSTQWAAYAFTGYRAGMGELDLPLPHIETAVSAELLELHARLDLGARAGRLALTAVIEEQTGATSYWALAHAPGKPDFHHAAGFALDLPEGSFA